MTSQKNNSMPHQNSQPQGNTQEERTERLQKVLANAGVASRRAAESMIVNGRVRVDGTIVYELGTKVDPSTAEIMVDNRIIQLDPGKRYVLLNKPVGIVSSLKDEQGKPDLRVFTDQWEDRLYNVGRLDSDTSGLLLLTNDGELSHIMSHPSFEVQKTYIAKVHGRIKNADIQRLYDGIELEDGIIAVDRARVLPDQQVTTSIIELTIHSGRNRIVRRMLKEAGFPVQDLARVSFGPLWLGSLPVGQMRELKQDEISLLLSRAKKAERRRDAETGIARLGDERDKVRRPAKANPHAKGHSRGKNSTRAKVEGKRIDYDRDESPKRDSAKRGTKQGGKTYRGKPSEQYHSGKRSGGNFGGKDGGRTRRGNRD